MLTYMKVKNVALIEEVELTLSPKLNIFSGETGAGKSMLIDSIQFAIGNRSLKQMIRKGEDMASVTLCFIDYIGLGIAFLKRNEIEYKQYENDFIPDLSIIDVMMFNSKEDIKKML